MINDGINNVPEKTIAIFAHPFLFDFNHKESNRLSNIIDKPSKKREWFTPHFYRCLPLTIGNQYGFIIKSEFDFSVIWNGEDSKESTIFYFYEEEEVINKKYPMIESHFGHGVITINLPFTLRTPPGVNLMTINPPNYIVPNLTTMTGVVEADNLRRGFTINLKIQIPNMQINIPAGSPLAAIIPIPRYFADSFELKYAEDIFSENEIVEELQAEADAITHREDVETGGSARHYLLGKDVYGNIFSDHQNP
jgi:hypothetical protein